MIIRSRCVARRPVAAAIVVALLGLASATAGSRPAAAAAWLPSLAVNPTASVSITNGGCLAVSATGNAYAAWADNASGTFQIRFACDTTGVWSPATVLTTTTWAHALQPAIAVDAKGHVHLAWADDRYGNYDIFYREWTTAGWKPEVRLTTGVKRSVSPCLVADTNAVSVVWSDDRDGNTEIYCKRRVAGVWGSDTRVTNESSESLSPSLGESSDGALHLVWIDRRPGYFGVYASDYTNGVWSAPSVISARNVHAAEPHVAIAADNTQHVIWSDFRSGMAQLYYRSRSGGVWSTLAPVGLSANAVDHASLAGGPSNTAALVWTENLGSGASGAYTSTRQGTAWTTAATLASNTGGAVQTLPAIGMSTLGDQIALWSNGTSDYLLDVTTARQPAAAPVILTAVPDSAMSGATMHLVVTGTNFMAPDSVWIAPAAGAQISALTSTSTNFSRIEADFTLAGVASGAASIIVRTADGRRDTLAAAFTVLPPGGWSFDTPLTVPGVNSYEQAGSRSLAVSDVGNVETVWIDERTGLPAVYTLESVADLFGVAMPVSLTTLNAQYPTVCTAPGNRVEVVWRDAGVGKTDLYWRERAAGLWGLETKITSYTYNSLAPAVASDLSGDVHLVWRLDLPGNQEIYYKKLHAGVWGADLRLTNATGMSTQPTIACGSGGRVYVAWVDGRNGSYEIYFKSFDGAVWSGDTRITNNTSTSSRPSIAVGPDGTVHLAWQDLNDGNLEIYYASFKNGVWSPTTRITNDPNSSQTPTLAVDGLGQVHIAWEDDRDGTSQIYYTMYAGGQWSAAARVSSGSAGSTAPSIAAVGSGTVHTLWADMRVSSANSIYYAQKRVIPVGIGDPAEADGLGGVRDLAVGVYPNPVRDVAAIRLALPREGEVTLQVFDVRGRLCSTVLRTARPAGESVLRWNATDARGAALPRGRYFLRADATWAGNGHAVRTAPLLLVR